VDVFRIRLNLCLLLRRHRSPRRALGALITMTSNFIYMSPLPC
jgi:hypothetical protein